MPVLDRSPDGASFLVLRYEMPPGSLPGAPGIWANDRLGMLPVGGGELIPLTKLGESTPSELHYSPDGQSVLGTMYRKKGGKLIPELVVFDVKSKTRTTVMVLKDTHIHGSCWSPDGKRVVYIWESHAAYEGRMNRFGSVQPEQKKKPTLTVTLARPNGSDARDVYTETESSYGSIDWSGAPVPGHPSPIAPGGTEKPNVDMLDDEAAIAVNIKALQDANGEDRPDPASLGKTKFIVAGLKNRTKIRVLFEDRDIVAVNDYFVDDFRGVDLYQRYGGERNGYAPVALHAYEFVNR